MSDLAYNLQGEHFQVPADAALWRVRRFKRSSGRGMPEVVFGDDGLPLTVPIDIDIDEFRRQVGGVPGKYRLDPIDAQQQPCEGALAAYVQFQEAGAKSSDGAAPSAPADGMLREVITANTEMVRAIADKFAQVMESAAVLLRAADGAGLPAREPVQPATPAAATEGDDDVDEIDPDAHPVAAMLQPVLQGALPLLNHTVNTKVLGLTHEQSIALLGGTPPAAATSAPPAAPTSAQAAQTEPASGTTPTSDSPSQASGSSPAASSSGDDAQRFANHMVAVQGLLKPDETALVIAAVKEMTPEALAVWREKLLAMSPEEAATTIRSEITKGGTSDDQ